jgi:hypothetical protein
MKVTIEIETEVESVECEAVDCHRQSATRVKITSEENGETDTEDVRLCDLDAYAISSGALFLVILDED